MDLTQLPQNEDLYILTDYIELLCLVNVDGIVTKADIIDRLEENLGLSELDDDNQEYSDDNFTVSEKKDRTERNVDDWFLNLSYRQGVFNAFYPFMISDSGDSLNLVKDLTLKHKFYVFLLLSSNLRYLGNGKRHKLTSTFEMISAAALKKMLPPTAEVHLFRPPGNMKNRRYRGNLFSRINMLAADLREKVLVKESEYLSKDNGDGGLDLVGWVPTGDEFAGGLVCVFGQCACTTEWVTKQHSSSISTWNQIMTFTSAPANMVFIPFCFRTATGEWWRKKDIHTSIVIDRVRFAYFLEKEHKFLETYPAYAVVEEFLSFKESLV